ncbi:hypothetical protein M885DRAFT_610859, partial [Pelagophyceae sp. CCMP2097]
AASETLENGDALARCLGFLRLREASGARVLVFGERWRARALLRRLRPDDALPARRRRRARRRRAVHGSRFDCPRYVGRRSGRRAPPRGPAGRARARGRALHVGRSAPRPLAPRPRGTAPRPALADRPSARPPPRRHGKRAPRPLRAACDGARGPASRRQSTPQRLRRIRRRGGAPRCAERVLLHESVWRFAPRPETLRRRPQRPPPARCRAPDSPSLHLHRRRRRHRARRRGAPRGRGHAPRATALRRVPAQPRRPRGDDGADTQARAVALRPGPPRRRRLPRTPHRRHEPPRRRGVTYPGDDGAVPRLISLPAPSAARVCLTLSLCRRRRPSARGGR